MPLVTRGLCLLSSLVHTERTAFQGRLPDRVNMTDYGISSGEPVPKAWESPLSSVTLVLICSLGIQMQQPTLSPG